MEIEIKERENKGFAIAHEQSTKVGMISYSISGSNFIIIDHTEGIGKKLLYTIIEMARRKNLKILPLCPFASAMFKKLDDIRDVLKP